MKFVMYCPVQFINDANDVLEGESRICIIKGKERKTVKMCDSNLLHDEKNSSNYIIIQVISGDFLKL